MRRVRPIVAGIAAVLPLITLTSACSRQGERRVVAPERPSDSPVITGARWVWEPTALASAVQTAGRSPLVLSALRQAAVPVGGLRPRFDLAIRAVGDAEGNPLSLTILPYAVDGDPTHAAFISVAQGFGIEGAELAEMIVGREPRADELGYHTASWLGRVVWIRTADPVVGVYGLPAGRAPMKRTWTKLFDCFVQRMPVGCAAGAAIAEEIVPGEPRAGAIGCGIGAALGGVACVADFIRDK